MRDSGLGGGVCPDEPPRSPVWGPLRTPPVTCGGLTLALELPALIRQLRAAWRARRGGPQGPERNQASTWVEAEKEEAEEEGTKQDIGNRSSDLGGNVSECMSKVMVVGVRFLVYVCLFMCNATAVHATQKIIIVDILDPVRGRKLCFSSI